MAFEPGDDESQRLLREAYAQGQVFLVLGAGVSLGSGLPTWPEMVRRLFVSCYAHPRPELFAQLTEQGMPLPVLASLLEENARYRSPSPKPREAFTDLVREALYRDFPWFPGGFDREGAGEFAEAMDTRNRTLRAVSALCVSRAHQDDTFAPNPRIRAVVTFNLDALLQAHSWAKYCVDPPRRRILRTVERPSAGSRPDKISVYHVHGFMQFDRRIGDPSKEAPDQMVLTEQNYFDAFNDPTRLFNYTLLHLLREYTAVFVGLSMQDENLRRLLHYSKMERVRSLQAERVPESAIRAKVLRHVALLEDKRDPDVRRAYEHTLAPLGVGIIWLRSFDEIPTRLAMTYEAAGGKWSDVYRSSSEAKE